MMKANEPADLSFWKIDDPRSAVGQTRATALMRSDSRGSYKHFALLEFHWGWAHKRYNWTSLASVRNIHATLKARNPLGVAPLSLPHINAGNRDLVEWGWLIEIEKGAGRNASRFIPNYALLHVASEGGFAAFLDGRMSFSVHPIGEHNGFGISVHLQGNSSVTYEVNANRFCVNPAGNKDPLTETGLQDRSTEKEGIDCAPAAPPPVDGLGATTAGSAQDGFEELWRAYGYRQKKAEAKTAYAKLSPTGDLRVRMIDAASKWRIRWAEQGNRDAPRFTLAKWIEREEYECEPPIAFKTKERKAKAPQPKPAPARQAANDNPAPRPRVIAPAPEGHPRKWPYGTFRGEFVGNDIIHEEGGKNVMVELAFEISTPSKHAGEVHKHRFYIQHQSQTVQEHDWAYYDAICAALDTPPVDDLDELLFRPLTVKAGGMRLQYIKLDEAAA